MPVFEYTATNSEGHPVRGTLLSPSVAAAAADLANQGYEVQHVGLATASVDPIVEAPRTRATANITEQRSYVQTDVVGPLVNRVPLSALLFFFRQLSTMLHAGMGMVQSLDTLAKQTSDFRLRKIMHELREHALAGRPISAGLQRYPEMFSPLMMSLVRVGEESGMMDKSLAQIADYVEREIELRNLLRRVTIYPKLVIAASIVIVLFTNWFIGYMGKSGGIDSILTRVSTWVVLGPLIVAIWLFVRIGLQNPRIKFQWDQFLLAIPLFGPTLRGLCMAKFGRAFGTLYAGGVPVPRAVELSADACGNEYLRAKVHPAAFALKEGDSITHAFTATGVFEPIVLDMTNTGETTGNVDFMLTKVAEFYEEEGKTKSVQFGYALGVLALLAVGVYVGYTVINFYMNRFPAISQQAGGEESWLRFPWR